MPEARGPGRRARWPRSPATRTRRRRRRGCGRRSSWTRCWHGSLPDGRHERRDRRSTRRQADLRHRHHRLPRHRACSSGCSARCPTASWCCSSGRASAPRSSSGRQGDLRQQLLRPPPRGARRQGRASPSGHRAPGCRSSPATSAATASASTTPAGPRSPPATSSSTRRPPSPSTARSTSPSRSTSSARPASPRRCSRSASRPTSSPCPPATSPATAGARRPRSCSPTSRSPSTSTGASEVDGRPAHPGRLRRREPRRRDARAVPQARPGHELGAAGTPLLAEKTEQRRSRWVTDATWSRPAAPAPAQPRLARRLRLHQGARRAGPHREPGRRAGVDRAAVDHRVGAGRAAAGLDPRLPHGRAGDHQLRPRPAEGVPRRARGRRRRHPGRPRRRRHDRRRRPRPAQRRTGRPTSPRSRPAASTRCATAASSTSVQTYFTEHPIYDREGPPIVVPEWTFPGRGRVQGQLETAQKADGRRREGAPRPAAAGQAGRALGQARGARGPTSTGPRIYVELYGAYVECEAVYGVDRLLALFQSLPPADQAAFGFDPRVIDWDHYATEIHLPSVVEHARVRTTAGGSHARRTASTACAARCSTRPATWPPSTSRTRSSRRTSWRRYAWLATRRLPWDDRVRFVPKTMAEAPAAAVDGPQGPGRLPPPLLPPLRGRAGRPARRGRHRAGQRPAAGEGVPRRRSGGCASTAPSGHRTLLITGALDFVIEPIRPLFDDIVCASMSVQARRHVSGELTDVPPTGESRAQALYDYCDANGFDPARVRRLRRLVLGPARCSRPPASRWRSTRRRSSPPSPAAAAGSSSTGTRPAAPAAEARSPIAAAAPRRTQPPPPSGCGRPVKALLFERKVARYAAAAVAGRLAPGRGARVGPLRLADVDAPELPAEGWVRVAPPVGDLRQSDLATIDGHSSRYFEPIVSFPFVPGHEVVGDARRRPAAVVLVPILTCAVRGIEPLCAAVPVGPAEPVRAGRLRPPRARPPDRLLRVDRRRVVDAARRPRVASSSTCPTTSPTSRPCSSSPLACAVHAARQRRRRRGRRHRQRHPRPAHHRRHPPPRPARRAPSSPPPSTRTRSSSPASSAPTSCASRRSSPATCAAAPARGSSTTGSPAAPATSSTASDRATRSSRRSTSSRPAAPSTPSACPASPPSTSPASGTARSRCAGCYAYTPDDFAAAISLVRELDLGRLVVGHLPPVPLRGRHRPRRQRRPPWRREDRLRPPRREGKEPAVTDASPRVRPAGRQVDTADPVLPRRAVPPRAAPGRAQPRHLPARGPSPPLQATPTPPSATRCCTRSTPSRCPSCCTPG